MIATLLAGALLNAQDQPWPTHRLAQTGLRIQFPSPPRTESQGKTTVFTFTEKSLTLSITATPDNPEDRPVASALYSEAFNAYRNQHGNRIRSVFNEAPVPEAWVFGAEESIGFVLEIRDSKTAAAAWQFIRADGWRYTLTATAERREQPLLERALGSVQYIDPKLGDFPEKPIGAIGLSSYLGRSFLPSDNVPVERATTLVLQSDTLPAVAVAGSFDPLALDYRTPDKLKEGLAKWLTSFTQGARANLELKPLQRPGIDPAHPAYQTEGLVTVQGVSIQIAGVVFTDPENARVVIVIIDPRTAEARPFADRLLRSVKPLPAEKR